MPTVYVETMNFNSFGFEFKKFRGHAAINQFLNNLLENLEDDDSFSIYSEEFEGAKRYKLTFDRTKEKDDEFYNTYSFELVDHAEGEEVLNEIYNGDSIERMKHLIWRYRTVINNGLWGGC